MERKATKRGRWGMAGYYEEEDGGIAQCTWSWDRCTGEIHDHTDQASICVGYADTEEKVLRS